MLVDVYATDTQRVTKVDLCSADFQPLKVLPEDQVAYFEHLEGVVVLPLAQLMPTRARPKGVRNANVLMKQALDENGPKRGPISVSWHEQIGRYIILDGNSTFLNAAFSGWFCIPTVLVNVG